MKICSCGKENYYRDNFCERCNQSIQHINHEPFQIQDHILKTFGVIGVFIVFIKGIDYLQGLDYQNIPTVYFQAIRLIAASAIIIVLLMTIYSSYNYDNPRRQNNGMSGDFAVYLGFNVLFILGIVVFIAYPDKAGITLFPSLLFYLAIPCTVIAFKKDIRINKQKVVSWALVLSILSFEFFLIGYYAVLIFAKYNLSPDLWWGVEMASFSLSFLFFGIVIGGIIAFFLIPPFKPYEFINYLLWSDPEDVILEIAFYGAIYIVFISPAIGRTIIYLAS